MRDRWIDLDAVINAVNEGETWADQMTALQGLMQILLAKISLNTGDMSDAIQEAFVVHERCSSEDIASIVSTFDNHLASLKN